MGPLITWTVLPWTSLVANGSEKPQEAQRVRVRSRRCLDKPLAQ